LSQEAAAPLEPQPGLSDVLLNLFVEPRTAFAAILKRPGGFWIPIVASVVLNLAFTSIWVGKMEPQQFMRNELEQSGRLEKIPPDQVETVIEKQSRIIKPISLVSAVLAPPLVVLVLGGLFYFVYRFFYGGEVTFAQSLAVVAWSSLAVAVVTIPLLLVVFFTKGDWNLNPQNVVQANLSLLLDRETTSRALWSLAESLDVFTAWFMFLLASGFGLAIRKPTTAALWGVVIPWAIYVVGKVGLVALMS
jgi:Yip1-like protein